MTTDPPPPSRPEWAADREVATDEVAAWLREAGVVPEGEVRQVAEGWDNLVFEVDGLYVRATRRRIAAPDVVQEVALLPLLPRVADLAVPRPVVVPDGVEALEWPWFAYRPIAGDELTRALLTGVDLRPVASALGRFLRALHAPELAERTRGLVREDTWRRGDMPYRRPRTLERLERLERAGHPIDGEGLRRIVAQGADLPVLPGVALVHGDLHFRHVLVGPGGAPRGIIDWGDAHLGHPSVDLHGYWAFFGRAPPPQDTHLSRSTRQEWWVSAIDLRLTQGHALLAASTPCGRPGPMRS